MLVSRRRGAGALLIALSTWAVILVASGRVGAIPGGFPSPGGNGVPATGLTLASVGSDAAAARGESAQPAIAENGRYVAFSSQAALKVSAAPPGTRPIRKCDPKLSSCSNVYVRDLIAHRTTLLGSGVAAPTISATGRLVSFQTDADNDGNTIYAVDRRATGKGALDAPGNLVVLRVTGTAKDLRYERIPPCPQGFGTPGAIRTAPCGPKLSADGITLAYPARLSPVSPALTAVVVGDTVTVINPGAQTSNVGTAASLQITATDSAAGQTLTYTATGLPAGLSIGPATGLISGTPTVVGTSSVTVTATDATGASGPATFTWTVNPATPDTVTVTNPGAQASTVGTAASLQITATDSAVEAVLTYTATGLPAGLSINPATGLISGTPTVVCICSVTVTATDTTAASGSATFSWTVVTPNTVTVTNPGAQITRAFVPVSLQITATDSDSEQTLTYTATGLPIGLSINSASGLISGTPTVVCICSVTVTATDTTGASGSAMFTWEVFHLTHNRVTVTNPGAKTSKAGRAVSPQTNEPTTGNELDLGTVFAQSEAIATKVITYTVNGNSPITFAHPSVTGPFSVSATPGGLPFCLGTFRPGASCQIKVIFNAGNPLCTADAFTLLTGTLRTNAAVPAGQSALGLTVYCTPAPPPPPGRPVPKTIRPMRARASGRPPGATPRASCPAAPKGLALTAPPPAELDNAGTPLIDLGAKAVGEPFVTWVPVIPSSPAAFSTVLFQSSTCAVQLVNPAALHLANPFPASAGAPPPCTQGETVTSDCLAYLLISPGAVMTDLASVTLLQSALCSDCPPSTAVAVPQYVAVTGVGDVVIARRDHSGRGDFAASPSSVVSVDGKGMQIPGASEPSVSATGRYLAFTAPVPAGQPGMQVGGSTEVWRHDTDAKGNSTFKPGPTALVSCLPTLGKCRRAANADSPSLSGDGTRVAFATLPAVPLDNGANLLPPPASASLSRRRNSGSRVICCASPDQVYARNIVAGTTVVVSMAATGSGRNGISYAPALSQDGTTVAFVSAARNLASVRVPARATNLYVRTLAFGPAPSTELATPTGASLPAGDDIGLPAIDAHGQIIAFQTSVRLLPAAPRKLHSVYAFERFPHLLLSPDPVNFGTLGTGTAARTVTITVTDTGPGPATVTKVATTPPFGVTGGTCTRAILYAGTSCQFSERFVPRLAGNDKGTATIFITGDGEPTVSSSVPVTAIVLQPRLSLTPDVDFAGQVTLVRGTGFLAGQTVTLSWSQGLGTVTVTVTASGTSGGGGFSQPMVIFPDDIYGPRMLLAKDSAGKLLATAPFLAQAPPGEPPFTSAPTAP